MRIRAIRWVVSVLVFFAAGMVVTATVSMGTEFTPDGVFGTPSVTDLAVSPDGSLVAAAYGASFVRVLDAETGEQLFLLSRDNRQWMAVAFSPDGSVLATAGRKATDGEIVEWDLATRSINREFNLTSATLLKGVGYSTDGSFIAASGENGTSSGRIGVWTTGDGDLVLDQYVARAARTLDISADGSRIAVCTDADARLFSVSTGDQVRLFDHDDCRDLEFSPDGARLATAGDPGVIVWDVASGSELTTMDFAQIGGALSYSPNGNLVAAGSASGAEDRGLIVFDAATGVELWCESYFHWYGHDDEHIDALSFAPDGRHIVAASNRDYDEGTGSTVGKRTRLRVFDDQTAQPILTLKAHSDGLYRIAYSNDGQWIATSARDDLAIVWNASTGQVAHTLSGHSGGVNSIDFSGNSSLLMTGSYDGTARIWDVASGSLEATLSEPGCDVRAVALSPDGTRAATAIRDGFAYRVDVWDVATETITRTISSSATDLDWHPAADEIVAAGGGTLSFFNPTTGASLRSIALDSPTRVVYSPNGARVLAGSNTLAWATLFNASTGAEVRRFPSDDRVDEVAFSADGTRVGTGSFDQTVRVFNVSTGAELSRFGDSTLVALSPDGARVAAANWFSARVFSATRPNPEVWAEEKEGLIGTTWPAVAQCPQANRAVSADGNRAILWDLQSGEAVRIFRGHSAEVVAVSCSRDASVIATGSLDGAARIYSGSSGVLLHELTDHSDEVLAVDVSPDGAWIVTGSADGTARIFDASTGAAGPVLGRSDAIDLVECSSDGTRVLTASRDGGVSVWNRIDGTPVRTLVTSYTYNPAAFSPDGTRVLAQRLIGTSFWIVEWDPDTGVELTSRKIGAGSRPAETLGYSALGDRAFIALDYPGTLLEFDLSTNTVEEEYSAHFRNIRALSAGTHGDSLLTGGEYETQILYWNYPMIFSDGFETGGLAAWD